MIAEKRRTAARREMKRATSDVAWRFTVYGLLGTLVFGVVCLELYLNGPSLFPVVNMGIFYHLIIHQDSSAVYLQAGILLAALALRPAPVLGRLIESVARNPLPVAAVTTALLAVCTLLLYHNHPLAMDEYIVRFQAQAFASGRLTGEFPPALLDRLNPHHSAFLLASAESGQVIAKYWPGYILLLTPFELLGIPWLLNPSLLGGSLLLLHRVARDLFPGHRLAPGWVILFALASPQLVVTSFSYYTMPGHLFFNLAFSALLLQPTPFRAAMAGLMGGMALFQHEPAPHLFYAVPWLFWVASRPGRWKNVLALAGGYLPVVLIVGGGYVWLRTSVLGSFTGSWPESGRPVGGGVITGLLSVVVLPSVGVAWVRLLAFLKLWLWGMPGLVVLAAIGVPAVRKTPALAAFGASFVVLYGASFFVPGSQGHGWGFRHLHYCYPSLLLFATAAILRSEVDSTSTKAQPWGRLPVLVGSVAVMSLILCNLQRGAQVQDFLKEHIARLPRHDSSRPGVVFVSTQLPYSVDLVQNHPLLERATWYLASRGVEADERLMARHFPGAQRRSSDGRGSVWELPRPPWDFLRQ